MLSAPAVVAVAAADDDDEDDVTTMPGTFDGLQCAAGQRPLPLARALGERGDLGSGRGNATPLPKPSLTGLRAAGVDIVDDETACSSRKGLPVVVLLLLLLLLLLPKSPSMPVVEEEEEEEDDDDDDAAQLRDRTTPPRTRSPPCL